MSSSAHGFVDSAKQLGENLIGSVHDRLELFSLELQEEKFRIIRVLILAISAIFSAFLALIFLSLTIVYLFWDEARLAVLIGFTIFYSAAFVGVLLSLRRFAAKLAAPFESTRRELAADRAVLRRD